MNSVSHRLKVYLYREVRSRAEARIVYIPKYMLREYWEPSIWKMIKQIAMLPLDALLGRRKESAPWLDISSKTHIPVSDAVRLEVAEHVKDCFLEGEA